jgi:ATP synthase I chain
MTTDSQPAETHAGIPGSLTETRIAWFTLVIGAGAAATAAALRCPGWALGLAIGAFLAWLNFRWLRRGMDSLVAASAAQEGAARPRVSLGTYFAAAFRYALIALAVYVNFKILKVPLASMMFGLCALGAAAIAASLYEVVRPAR